MTWNKLRWIFPVIFAGIMVYQLYGRVFPTKPWKTETKFAPRPENVFTLPREDVSEIEGEFNVLFNVVVDRAVKDGGTPPASLAGALEAARRSWPGNNMERFNGVFRLLLNPNDPWGQPYVYQVDTQAQTVSLQSFGPNGRDEPTGGDDIYVIKTYDKLSQLTSQDETEEAEVAEDSSPNKFLIIALASAVAAAAGYVVVRRAGAQ